MSEVYTFERLDFEQQQVDTVFAGMVASMNMVHVDFSLKGDKFGATLPQEVVNTNTDIIGGMSLAEQEKLKADADKFDPELIAQAYNQQQLDERQMLHFFDLDDAKHKAKKESPSNWQLAA